MAEELGIYSLDPSPIFGSFPDHDHACNAFESNSSFAGARKWEHRCKERRVGGANRDGKQSTCIIGSLSGHPLMIVGAM